MGPYNSAEGYIGLAKQTVKGTGVAPSKFLKFLEDSFNPEQEIERLREGGDGQNVVTAIKKFQRYGGDFSCNARPDMAGFLLAMLLGADSISGVGPYDHAITPADTIPWVTLEKSNADVIVNRITDCKFNEATIEFESGMPPKITIGALGISGAVQASPATDTYETEDPFVFHQGVYTLDSGATTDINKCSIKINRNLDGDIITTEAVRAHILERGIDVDVDFTLKFENAAHYKNVYYGGGTAEVTTVYEGDITLDLSYGAGAAARGFKIEIPALKHQAAPVNLAGSPETVYQECVGFAVKGAGDLITVTAKNNEAAAYI